MKGSNLSKILLTTLFLILIVQDVNASRIKVDISENMRGDFVFVNYTVSNNTVNATTEFYNTGSVAYGARLRLILNDKSVWTQEKNLYPGNRAFFQIQAFSEENVSARLQAYYGNEILEDDEVNLMVPPVESYDAFEVSDFRTYNDRIEFNLKSSADTVAIFEPLRYPPSWIFESKKIGPVKNGTVSRISVKYHTPIFSQDTITFAVFSENGLYYSERTEKMEIRKADYDAWKKILQLFLSPVFLLSKL